MPKKVANDDWSSGEEDWRSEDEFLDGKKYFIVNIYFN